MSSSHHRHTIVLGIFLFISLLILAAGILLIGRLHNSFVSKFTVYSVLDQVGGLQKGNNIWLSGVKIGTIGDVRFTGKSKVQVTMKIDKAARPYVRRDARAKVSTDGMLGNKIIVISVGSDDSPCVQNGDTIGFERALSTDDMMVTLQENNRNLVSITSDFREISRRIREGQGTLGKLLADDSLYTSVRLAVAELGTAAGHAEKLTASLADFSKNLNKNGSLAHDIATDTVVFTSLRGAIEELGKIAVTAASITADLKKASAGLGSTGNTAGMVLGDPDVANDLRSTLKNLESGSRKLNEDLEALQHSFLLRGYFRKKDQTGK